jgi:RNA polymerase sigma-70 factor, ECF subfamily
MINGPDFLWYKIKLGDQKAFSLLFRELFPSLCNFAQRMLNNLPESEETVQDVFIHLWQNKEKINLKGSLKSYLYQSVHNLAINKLEHFRTLKFQPNMTAGQEEWKQIHHLFITDDAFIQMFEAHETENIILSAMEELPEKCREIFRLSRFENLSNKEISDQLNLSQSTVRVQIFRAIAFLKDFLNNTY